MFIDALDVDDVIAHLLVAEGFTSLGAGRLRAARGAGRDRGLRRGGRRRAAGPRRGPISKSRTASTTRSGGTLASMTRSPLSRAYPRRLAGQARGEAGIKTLDDLGDLASDELIEIARRGAWRRVTKTANRPSSWQPAPIGSTKSPSRPTDADDAIRRTESGRGRRAGWQQRQAGGRRAEDTTRYGGQLDEHRDGPSERPNA